MKLLHALRFNSDIIKHRARAAVRSVYGTDGLWARSFHLRRLFDHSDFFSFQHKDAD